jgi:anti-sigma regulatory factor (Ser/Thr protein kinase)
VTALAPSTFEHEVLHYRGDAQFARVLGAFVREGLEADEAVAIAESPRLIDLLRDELGDDAESIRFQDLTSIGGNPARIIAFWDSYAAEQAALGRRIRGIGEPAWPGRRDVECSEVRIHELLVNRIFDDGPGWRLVCPYDADRLPASVLEASLRTHPLQLLEHGRSTCDDYRAEAIVESFAAALAPPPDGAVRMEYGLSTLSDVRRAVTQHAQAHAVPRRRTEDLVLASSEIAANSATHGGGVGLLQLWRDCEGLQVQLSDPGHILEPLVGRRLPPVGGTNGRGVFLANQLCDLVQLRSSRDGTTARLTTWVG